MLWVNAAENPYLGCGRHGGTLPRSPGPTPGDFSTGAARLWNLWIRAGLMLWSRLNLANVNVG